MLKTAHRNLLDNVQNLFMGLLITPFALIFAYWPLTSGRFCSLNYGGLKARSWQRPETANQMVSPAPANEDHSRLWPSSEAADFRLEYQVNHDPSRSALRAAHPCCKRAERALR
jgi:hypothetical protein